MLRPNSLLTMITILALTILYFPEPTLSRENSGGNNFKVPSKFALLVGINDYLNKNVKVGERAVNDLNGPHNDVVLMKDLLKEYDFKETKTKGSADKFPCGNQAERSQLRTLCSRQATKKAIIDAFKEHLIENARKYMEQKKVKPKEGANIVFFYSGHGSFLDDDNGDESDGLDETIVPTDAKWDGTNQIRDDEFNTLVTELRQYTKNITLIFDSCNSGTVTRGPCYDI